MQNKRIYFDHAAATPVDPRVMRAMRPYFEARFGNPGSLHSFGQEAIAAVDRARETISCATGVDFRGVVFTASATEANNLALRQATRLRPASAEAAAGRQGFAGQASERRQGALPRIVVSAIEHESVLETARALAREGAAEVVEVPVDRRGVVDLAALRAALTPETALVSVMYGNNETGTVEPIAKIAEIVRDFREATGDRRPDFAQALPGRQATGGQLLFHTDAAQAFGYLPCRLSELGVDMMTISAQKIGGPKGAGALVVRQGYSDKRQGFLSPVAFSLSPEIIGGNQEFGLRSGTENVPAIAGFGKAVELVEASRERDAKRVRELRARFLRGMKKIAPRMAVHGGNAALLPHIANVRIPGVPAEALLTALDRAGVALSAGSACSARSAEPSRVLLALGHDRGHAKESVRASFGRTTSPREIDTALARIKVELKRF